MRPPRSRRGPGRRHGLGGGGPGFAIPVNLAIKVADEIIDTGSVTHAFIGIQAEPLPASATGQGGAQGLRVAAVAGGPAASAGLRVGDIITSIDGQPAASTDQLTAVTLSKGAGRRAHPLSIKPVSAL